MTAVKREDVMFFLSLFKDVEHESYALLRDAGIPNDVFNATYTHLPENTIKNLIARLGEQTCKEDFAVNVWLACKQAYVPRFLQQVAACLQSTNPTVKQAIDTFGELLPLASSGGKVSLQQAGGKSWLVREKAFSDEAWFMYAEWFSVIFLNELLASLIGDEWQAKEIGIQHHDATDFQFLPQLRDVQFYTTRPVTAILLPDDVLNQPAQLKESSEGCDLGDAIPSSFLAVFKLVISPYLSTGKLPIKWAAQILNLNVRTIQRRLDIEGVTYSDVIEQMVLEHALTMLKTSSHPITAIAIKLGYSDSAHFTRAFKRQMKMTPSQYRKLHR
ncbi:AraC family transcriptional regulator [Photobacterium jeanii]|uniref:AraC family transcriptional regulator n=1 Tax=Photobacterium jeanii TaxID=858640 RepID=A0A178K414_9GAMM|nr:AraC family transcriptional regulator [Photobacterium jeanii]PST91229.1 AraC family transcriptional regulator [Photobacterium jeanii]